jgi:hypothetical protein
MNLGTSNPTPDFRQHRQIVQPRTTGLIIVFKLRKEKLVPSGFDRLADETWEESERRLNSPRGHTPYYPNVFEGCSLGRFPDGMSETDLTLRTATVQSCRQSLVYKRRHELVRLEFSLVGKKESQVPHCRMGSWCQAFRELCDRSLWRVRTFRKLSEDYRTQCLIVLADGQIQRLRQNGKPVQHKLWAPDGNRLVGRGPITPWSRVYPHPDGSLGAQLLGPSE